MLRQRFFLWPELTWPCGSVSTLGLATAKTSSVPARLRSLSPSALHGLSLHTRCLAAWSALNQLEIAAIRYQKHKSVCVRVCMCVFSLLPSSQGHSERPHCCSQLLTASAIHLEGKTNTLMKMLGTATLPLLSLSVSLFGVASKRYFHLFVHI